MSLNRYIIPVIGVFISSFILKPEYCFAQLNFPEKNFEICKDDIAVVPVTISGTLPVFVELRHVQSSINYTYTSETANAFQINFKSIGTYRIISYGNANDTIEVISDSIVISNYPPVSLSLEGDGTFCTSSQVDPVNILFGGTAPYTLFFLNNGISDTITTRDKIYSFSANESRTIETIAVSDSFCSLDTVARLTHEIKTLPAPQIMGDSTLCTGEQTRYSSDISTQNYNWMIPPEAVYISPSGSHSNEINLQWTTAGHYIVRLQLINNEEDCASEWDNLNVNVADYPVSALNIDTTACFDYTGSFEIQISVLPEETVYWPQLEHTGSSCSFSEAGNYTYFVKNENECADTGFVEIADSCTPVLFVPEAFTPNFDQINDVLELFGLYYNLEFHIYSESGQLLFTMQQVDDYWDGTSDGKDLPNGTYYWYAKYTNRSGNSFSQNGRVNLIR